MQRHQGFAVGFDDQRREELGAVLKEEDGVVQGCDCEVEGAL